MLSFRVFQLWIYSAFLSNGLLAKFVFDIQDNFEQCRPNIPLPAFNLSEFEFSQLEGKTMQLSGKVLFVKEYGGFVRLDIHSQRLQRGTWSEGEISRSEPNLCAKIQFPMEPWYSVTKHFHQKNCPFKAGHLETLPVVKLDDFGVGLPAGFAGDWKFFFEVSLHRQGKAVKECVLFQGTIVEV